MDAPLNIPHLFTRVRICRKCLINLRPYASSEDLKHRKLRYVVRTHDEKAVFKIRSQSKPAQVGFTPHLFKVERARGFTPENPVYQVHSACTIENCGAGFMIVGPEQIQFTFDFGREEILTEKEVLAIYNYKDREYMLDDKEEQFHITPEFIANYSSN